MRPYPQHAIRPPPRVFNYSLDWRFLLPPADPNKVCLLYEENADFSQALEQVGLHVAQKLSLSDLKDRKIDRFQVMIMPFGLPVGWAGTRHEDQVEFYSSIWHLIDPGGYLLIGFNNSLNRRANSETNYYTSTPRRMMDQLKKASFQSIKVFGAMSNLAIPEYMFDLDPRTIQFALQSRFRRKPAVLHVLQALAWTISWKRVSNFLPCYFAVGTA